MREEQKIPDIAVNVQTLHHSNRDVRQLWVSGYFEINGLETYRCKTKQELAELIKTKKQRLLEAIQDKLHYAGF